MKRHNKEELPEDDGHTIADMNVEGMPWYRKREKWDYQGEQPEYSKKERRAIIWGTLKAALLVGFAFIGAFFLLILVLCIVAWIRYK